MVGEVCSALLLCCHCELCSYLPSHVNKQWSFSNKVFCGTFSQDGNTFLSACQGAFNHSLHSLMVGRWVLIISDVYQSSSVVVSSAPCCAAEVWSLYVHCAHYASMVLAMAHSRCASQWRWSRCTIPNEHGRRQDCGCWLHRLMLNILCWLQQNDVTAGGLLAAMFVGEDLLANRRL